MWKRKSPIRPLLLAGVLCLVCCACGTSALSNAQMYFDNTETILQTMFSNGQGSSEGGGEQESQGEPLATPVDFTIDEDGNYSFTGVEGADYYLMYFCDADASAEAEDDFLFLSDSIPADQGVETYTGNCADVCTYAFGDYLVKVLAFPQLGDSTHSASEPATAEYTFSGYQSAPQLAYFWNTFDGTLEFQLTNADEYTYEAYPDQIDITLTDVDSGEQTTIAMEEVQSESGQGATSMQSLAESVPSLVVDTVARDRTYQITAVAVSSNPYVLNPTSDETEVGQQVTFGASNVLSEGFAFSDGLAHGNFSFPRVSVNFDLENGGSAGDYDFGDYDYSFEATPTTPTDGSLYSYTLVIPFVNPGIIPEGMLELYPDGTLLLYETAAGPVEAGSMEGSWVDNGDGTATLSYNPSTLSTG